MGLRRTCTWLAIAPLGLALTTGLTITTTLLTQQPIGLSSEPLSAGEALAPRATTAAATGIRAHAAHPASEPLPHGGRALTTGISGTHAASVTPPVATPNAPTTAQATTTTTRPPPAKQPAHTPASTQTPTRAEGHRGRGGRRSSDGGGNDNRGDESSGSGPRDD